MASPARAAPQSAGSSTGGGVGLPTGRGPPPSPAPELYFLMAKLLSIGPLAEIGQTLRKELSRCKVLPMRSDWEGTLRQQTFEDLERQYPSVADDHLLSVCKAILTSSPNGPKKSLLCTTLFCKKASPKAENIVDILTARSLGRTTPGGRGLNLPAPVYGSLQLQRRTLGHLSAVYCVLFDRTGRYVITGADDFLVKIWSAIDGRLLGTLRGASAEITDMAVDTDNQLVAAGSLDRLVRVWDMQTGAPVAVLQGHTGMITSVHFCPAHAGDLSCLVSTSTDGSVAFWTYSQAKDGKPSFISKPVQFMERMRPGASQMVCAAWSPGGTFLASGSADHHVRVYMMAESGPKRILETAAHSEAVDSLQWAHSGLRFVSGSKDGSAIMWQLHAMQWRHIKLNMSDTLPGEPPALEESKKLKVTMVAWDCMDNYVITAVSDHSLKVWCSHTGKLVRILRGHNDEAYVLEAHPTHPAILLSAGHDGQIFFWNIITGETLNYFMNNIDGQGYGAVFDAKWSPEGTKVAATDSHGHILILGLGKGHALLDQLPKELFFHTDYRPLVWDGLGGVCDEQTGIPPHLMSPPFLVDVEGNPHPPLLQRLVPGREYATYDQLIPDIGAGDVMLQDGENPRSRIAYMIEALAMRQIILLNNNDDNREGNRSNGNRDRGSGSASTSAENSNSSGNSNQSNRTREERSNSSEGSQMEGRVNDRLQSPSQMSNRIRNNSGEWQRGDVLRNSHSLISPLSIAVSITRRLYIEEMTQMEMAWYAREMRRRPVMISTSNGNESERHRRGGARGGPRPPRKPRPPPRQDYDEPPELASPQDSDSSDSTLRFSISGMSGLNSNSSQSDPSDDSSNSSSSEYSDWVADQPGVPLEPPKRSKRKPARQTQPQPVRKKGDSDLSRVQVTEIPEQFRPSEWLCAVLPRKAPYHPQMGDECMYFKQGHSKYLDAVVDKNIYKVSSRDKPWERIELKDCETVKVIGIKYVIRPPRLVCLKLALENGTTFTIRYHDMPDVIDFFVLRQMYETAVDRNWKPGDRFRCMIDDGWWMGAIVDENAETSNTSNLGHKSNFLSLRVRWDNGEYEHMSPWDLEPIDESRLPQEVGGWVSVLPNELQNLLYRPGSEEWPGGDRDEACSMIAHGIDQVMRLAIAEPFIAPVDLNVYPTYAYVVEYPIDLSTIKSRFENHFYRRVTSAQFDVRYLATNAEKFNLPHTAIVKQARVITELCLQIIRCPFEIDVQSYYHHLMDSYNSSDSDVPLAKHSSKAKSFSRRRRNIEWYSSCRTVLKGIIAASDSAPFREPVPIDQLPEYREVVSKPMDLSTIKSRLESGLYQEPKKFGDDMRLIFNNSKLYNTNKKSQIYAMTIRLASLFETLFSPVMENWKAARRKLNNAASSDDSISDFDDEIEYSQNSCNSLRGITSSSCSVPGLQNGTGKSKSTSFSQSKQDNLDSSDSDAPLQEPRVYKGKGKGKRTVVNGESSQKTIRPSTRFNGGIENICENSNFSKSSPTSNENGGNSNGNLSDYATVNSRPQDDDNDDDDDDDNDSGETYKPSKKSNGLRSDLFYNGRTKRKNKKKDKKHDKRNRKKAKAPKRKRNVDSEKDSSSSDTELSVASVKSGRRYESDHSFQLRPDSDSDSDSDDKPLGRIGGSDNQVSQDTFPRSSRLRQRFTIQSDDSEPGTSGYTNRARRTARDSKRPKYNEDSEEDSIAAISKRLRAHQRPHNSSMLLQSRNVPSMMRTSQPTTSMNGNGPSTSNISDARPSGSGVPRQRSPINTFTAEDDEPLSISSRGRIRRLTAKAKNLLRD